MIKNEKGITLIVLIITIIVLLILLSTALYVGIDTYRESLVTAFVTQMQILQKKVDNLVAEGETNIGQVVAETGKENNIGAILRAASLSGEISNWDSNTQNIKYFDAYDIKTILDIDNINFDIAINFDTREIISLEGIEYEGVTYYTQYNLEQGQKLKSFDLEKIQNNRSNNLSFDEIYITRVFDENIQNINDEITLNGLSCLVVVPNIGIQNGTLRYMQEGGNWQIISKYTLKGKDYAVNITKSGTYIFKLTDNTNDITYEDEIYVEVINNPTKNIKLSITTWTEDYDYSDLDDSTNWAYATANGKTFLWIPRFAYKDDDIKFLRGTTNVSTDETFIDSSWTVPDDFTSKDEKVTGIWKQVNSETGNDLLDLLNISGL